MTHETKHTPGPWSFKIYKNSMRVSGPDKLSVSCVSFKGKRSVQEKASNLRLISAAPELLEALEMFVVAVDNQKEKEIYAAYLKARAAVKKAKGE